MNKEAKIETIVTAPAGWGPYGFGIACDIGPSLAIPGLRRFRIEGDCTAELRDDPDVSAIGLHIDGQSPMRPLLEEIREYFPPKTRSVAVATLSRKGRSRAKKLLSAKLAESLDIPAGMSLDDRARELGIARSSLASRRHRAYALVSEQREFTDGAKSRSFGA